jgi:hypothetical protein
MGSNNMRRSRDSFLPSEKSEGYSYGFQEKIHEDMKRVINHDYFNDNLQKLRDK